MIVRLFLDICGQIFWKIKLAYKNYDYHVILQKKFLQK